VVSFTRQLHPKGKSPKYPKNKLAKEIKEDRWGRETWRERGRKAGKKEINENKKQW
jgi:hypothetical protein